MEGKRRPRFRRIAALDQAAGRLWARLCGMVLILLAMAATMSLVGSEGFTPATHWPGLLMAGVFFVIGVACLRSRSGLIDTLDDMPPSRRKKNGPRE